MNLKRVQLIAEHPTHYELDDGSGPFRVAKSGLDDKLRARIQGFAKGGEVKAAKERLAQAQLDDGRAPVEEMPPTRPLLPYTLAPSTTTVMPGEKRDYRESRENPDWANELEVSRADGGFIPDPMALPPRWDAPSPTYAGPNFSADAGTLNVPAQPPPANPFHPEGEAMRGPFMGTNAGMAADEQKAAAAAIQNPIKSLRRESAPPTGTTSPPPPVAPIPTKGVARAAQMADPRSGRLMQESVNEESAANRERARLEGAQAVATAKQLSATANVIQAHQIEQKQIRDRAAQESAGLWEQYRAAMDDMRKVDTSVDPGRYWASRSTGGKILGAIGLALGSLSPDGVNRAAQLIAQSIDRDIDAQKAETSARLAKAQGRASQAQSAFGIARNIFQDELAAHAATQAGLLDLANNQLQQVAASYTSDIAKANAAALSAQLKRSQAGFEQKSEDAVRDDMTRRYGIAAAERAANIKTPAGGAERQKLLDEVDDHEANIQRNAQELESLIRQYGTQEKIEPGVEAKMNQLRSALIVDAAKMKDPSGVVREPDEAREGRALGFEPGFWQRDSNAIASIRSFAKGAGERKSVAYRARGLQAP